MADPAGSPAYRRSRLYLRIALALLAVFVAYSAVMFLLVRHRRYASDADLLAELASATFLDDVPSPADTWPQWRGVGRDGLVRVDALATSWPGRGPKKRWTLPGGDGYASFAVDKGRAYTAYAEDDGDESVVCLDVEKGAEVWKRRTSLSGRAPDYSGPRATPTVADGRLYTFSSLGSLACLSLADGSVVWERDVPKELNADRPKWGWASSPLVEGGRVFVLAGGRNATVAAYDAKTGEPLYSAQSDPAGYSSPVAATIDGKRHLVCLTGRRLLGVSPEDGSLLWEFPWADKFEVNAATPVVIRATSADKRSLTYVFISSGYGEGCALVKVESSPRGYRAVPVFTSNELCCHFASPVRVGSHLYALDETRDLTCLDLRTGQPPWRFTKTDGATGLRNVGFKKGSLLGLPGQRLLVVLGEDGKLALVRADPDGYEELTAARVSRDRCWSTPVFAGKGLLVRDRKTIQFLDLGPEGE